METKFALKPEEAILYRSLPVRKWVDVALRIGLGIIEVVAFGLVSFTALTSLATGLLGKMLPADVANLIGRILFQAIAPLLVIGWLVEDTARIFSSELILTTQRIWTRGHPFAWTREREIPLNDIKSMTFRRDSLFIHLRSTRKTPVYGLADGKQIIKAFTQFTGKTEEG